MSSTAPPPSPPPPRYLAMTMTMTMTMTLKAGLVLAASVFFVECIKAQQFTDLPLYNIYPGVSDACTQALNTTVANCPAFLGVVSVNNPRLSSDQLKSLCTIDCHNSLTSARQTIAQGCTNASSDIIVYDYIAYPGNRLLVCSCARAMLSDRTRSHSRHRSFPVHL